MTPQTYPEDPAGPFPEPPLSFVDAENREIEVRCYDPGAAVPEALVEMYEAFDPGDRAQGIPPSGEERIRPWLAELFETGYNVVAWHGETAAGHATLVPEDEHRNGGSDGDPYGGDGGNGAEHGEAHDGNGGNGAEHGEAHGGDGATGAGTDDAAGAAGADPTGEAGEQPPHELAIFVLQAYQRAGIGRQLLETLLGFWAANGIDRVWLTVERWNRAAVGLYEDVGFEVTDARTFEHEMCLRLA